MNCIELKGCDNTARQFLKDLDEVLDNYTLTPNKLKLTRVIREKGEFFVSYDDDEYHLLSDEYSLPARVFIGYFGL